MTQKEKDLLLNDLCARLSHRPKIWFAESNSNDHLQSIWYDNLEGWQVDGDNLSAPVYAVKPYLFPLSSMTEEQKREYNSLRDFVPTYHYEYGDIVEDTELYDNFESIDYLIANHFDYRGLIPMGIAIDATNKNIY